MATIIFEALEAKMKTNKKLASEYLLNSTVMELTKDAILIFLAMLHTWKIKSFYASINKKYWRVALSAYSDLESLGQQQSNPGV